MKRFEKIVLGITGGSHLSVHALMLALPSLIPILRDEFNIGLDTLGLVVTISAFMFGLGAIPSGWAERKLGGRALLLLYLFGSGLSAILVSISGSFIIMVAGLGMMGFFCSIYHPAGLTLISHRVNALTRGMAIHGIFGTTGSAIGPIMATALAALISWRASYAVLGLFNLLLGLATIAAIPSRKHSSEEAPSENHVEKTNRPALIYFYLTSMLMGMAYYGFTTFMPTHFAENTNQFLPFISGNMKAGIFPTMVFLAGIVGQIIGGRLGSRYNRPKLFMILVAVNIPFFILMGISTDLMLVLFSLCLGIAFFSIQPISNTLIAEFTHSDNRGLGYGISFFLSFGIGSFAAGFGGYIAENMGVASVFPIMGFLLIPGLFTSYMIIKKS
ncbi:MAG: MFS transporter [Candidatus Marinimicrobia bacterium]|nr:MFS transporter [Candidatus Neomarinimicrobiota bacterium]